MESDQPSFRRDQMRRCCIDSFIGMGIAENFRAHADGDTHQCDTCGRVWRVVDRQWEEQLAH